MISLLKLYLKNPSRSTWICCKKISGAFSFLGKDYALRLLISNMPFFPAWHKSVWNISFIPEFIIVVRRIRMNVELYSFNQDSILQTIRLRYQRLSVDRLLDDLFQS